MFNFFNRKADSSEVTPEDIQQRQAAGEDLFILDVREPAEYVEAHIGGSKLLPLGLLTNRMTDLPQDRPIVAVCRSGNRSSIAQSMLKRAGFVSEANNMPSILLAATLGALIGLALGTLGGGGSILTVPALVYLLGQNPHGAVGSSLVIVGTNALLRAWLHQRAGHVRLRAALVFGAVGVAAAFGGARLSRLLPGPALLVLFALLMLAIASVMLRGQARTAEAKHPAAPVWWRVTLGGVGVGFLTGFFGVGGGFLIVPALVLLLGRTCATQLAPRWS